MEHRGAIEVRRSTLRVVALAVTSLATLVCLAAMAFCLHNDQERAAIALSMPTILCLCADAALEAMIGD